MKLGLILECPKKGTDYLVYEYVIKTLCPDMELSIIPAGSINKPDMINKCGKIAELLLSTDKCDLIAIIWDLMPAWGGKACRRADKKAILMKLTDNNVDLTKVKLICIEPELEAWLIVDGHGITQYKRKLCHPNPVKPFKGSKLTPHSNESKKIISRYLARRYNDLVEAISILKNINDFDRIARKHLSFKRLKNFIEEICP